MSVYWFARAAVSAIMPQISFTVLLIALSTLLKIPSILPAMLSLTWPIFPMLSATLRVAVTALALSASSFRKLSPTPSSSFFMFPRVARALFSFCSQLAMASSLSAYFSRTSCRVCLYALTIFSCSAICFFRFFALASAFSLWLAFRPISAVSAFSSLRSVFRFRLASLIAALYSFSPSSTIRCLISFAIFSPA